MDTSPSDVLQDYTHGYGDDEEPDAGRSRAVRSTAPLAISRKGRPSGGMDSPGLGPPPGSARDMGRRRYDDNEDDMR